MTHMHSERRLRWMEQFWPNPNPACKRGREKRTIVPTQNPTILGRALTDSFHINVMSLQQGSIRKVLPLTICAIAQDPNTCILHNLEMVN